MPRTILVSILALAQTLIFAVVASAGELDFRDEFDSFDPTRWSKQEHALGRSYLDPSNVFVRNGGLKMKLPSGTLEGAEIASNELYRQGIYIARMRIPYAPSSITAFFLYKSPDYEHEIDVELYNDSSRRIMFTTHSGGSTTNHETMMLPFDPTRGLHNYRFDYGTGYVKFYVDGELMKAFRDGIPDEPMYLLLNSWFPSWLAGAAPDTNRYASFDFVRYTQY